MENILKRHNGQNLLLIVLNHVNPFDLGWYGSRAARTPALDSLGAGGVVWESAISQSTESSAIDEEIVKLSEKLSKSGYNVMAAFPGNFDSVKTPFLLSLRLPAQDTADAGGYEEKIAAVDRQIGIVMKSLHSAGLDSNTVVVVVGANGYAPDTPVLSDSRLRVPLILRIPGEPAFKGLRLRPSVGNLEIFPLLYELLLPPERPPLDSGRSDLIDILAGKDEDERFVLTRSLHPDGFVLRSRRYKLIHYSSGPADQLYFLLDDPEEKENEIESFPILVSFLKMQIQKSRAGLSGE
jgi:arylsulfatase A-like enzyme